MSKTSSVSTKRVRCTNFSALEETTLVALTAKYCGILECKKSDNDIWSAKNKAWMDIQQQFIATVGSHRELQNLKDKYENLKRKTKKIEGDRKKQIFQTGGGVESCTVVASSPTHNTLLGILGVGAVGLNNPFDGDKSGKPLMNINEFEEEIVGVNDLDDEYVPNVNIQESVDMESEVDRQKIDDVVENAVKQPTWAKWNPLG